MILVGKGYTERQIAGRLEVSMETVKSHLREARRAYEVTKTIQLIVELLKQGHITVADMIIR